MERRLFCQLGPGAYRISVAKGRAMRRLRDLAQGADWAACRRETPLPVAVYRHKSLIRRRLGDVDMSLQENKAVNLALAAKRVDGILIRPGETFSFWRMVGNPTARRGYREGLTIACGAPSRGIGGGLCQCTNLIHWMVLHTPLEIVEHHHHDGLDLFPDYHRQIPFGTGTSILYNYLDYRFYNPTRNTFQLMVYTTDRYLCGELRADQPLDMGYHIRAEGERFVEEGGVVYREGALYRRCVDKRTGGCLYERCIRRNHARVCYDTAGLEVTHVLSGAGTRCTSRMEAAPVTAPVASEHSSRGGR